MLRLMVVFGPKWELTTAITKHVAAVLCTPGPTGTNGFTLVIFGLTSVQNHDAGHGLVAVPK